MQSSSFFRVSIQFATQELYSRGFIVELSRKGKFSAENDMLLKMI